MILVSVVIIPACALNKKASEGRQKLVLDSLSVVNQDQIDEQDISKLYDIAFTFIEDDKDSLALIPLRMARAASFRLADSLWMVKTTRVEGTLMKKNNNLSRAIQLLKSVQEISAKLNLTRENFFIAYNLGILYNYKASYDSAVYYNLQALRIATCLQCPIKCSGKRDS